MGKVWSARGHKGVSQGSPGGQPFARGSARGQVGVSQGSARESRVIGIYLYETNIHKKYVADSRSMQCLTSSQ